MQKSKAIRCGLLILALIAIAALVIVSFRTPAEAGEGYQPFGFQTAWALLPPVAAIALALITKEVYFPCSSAS